MLNRNKNLNNCISAPGGSGKFDAFAASSGGSTHQHTDALHKLLLQSDEGSIKDDSVSIFLREGVVFPMFCAII